MVSWASREMGDWYKHVILAPALVILSPPALGGKNLGLGGVWLTRDTRPSGASPQTLPAPPGRAFGG